MSFTIHSTVRFHELCYHSYLPKWWWYAENNWWFWHVDQIYIIIIIITGNNKNVIVTFLLFLVWILKQANAAGKPAGSQSGKVWQILIDGVSAFWEYSCTLWTPLTNSSFPKNDYVPYGIGRYGAFVSVLLIILRYGRNVPWLPPSFLDGSCDPWIKECH